MYVMERHKVATPGKNSKGRSIENFSHNQLVAKSQPNMSNPIA